MLGNEGRVTPGAVVHNEVHGGAVGNAEFEHGDGLFHHRGLHHTFYQAVEGVGHGIGIFISGPLWCKQANDAIIAVIQKPFSSTVKLGTQGRKPGPVGKDLSHAMLFQDVEQFRCEICFSAQLEMVSRIRRQGGKKIVKCCCHMVGNATVLFALIFLLEDKT